MPSSMFSIPVESWGLLRTPDNLKLQILERRDMVELVFTIIMFVSQHIGPVGLLRDVSLGYVGRMGGFIISLEVALLAVWTMVQATFGKVFEKIWEQVP